MRGLPSRIRNVAAALCLVAAPCSCEDATDSNTEPGDHWWTSLHGSGPTVREMLGVSTHMKQDAGESDERDFEFARYSELGGIRIRQDYHWHKLEPVNDELHFDRVQTQVELARESGVSILAMLAYGVDWAETDGTTSSIEPADYADFAGRVAAELCDDIKEYEIWNEQNTTRFWSPAPDPQQYGEFLAAACTAIHAACPDARVLFGGLLSFDSRAAERWWFLREVHAAHPDLCQSFDILGLHPYTFNQRPSPEHDEVLAEEVVFHGQVAMTRIAREILAEMGCADKPIWFTEAGWPSYELSEAQQGRFLARSALLAARDRAETWFWYTFWDGEPTDEGFRPHERYFGLFGWPGDAVNPRRQKPAWQALSTLSNVLGGSRFAADLSDELALPEDVFALAFVDDAEQITLALWDGRDNPDVGLGGEPGPGGPDTEYALTLELPSWAREVVIASHEDGASGESAEAEVEVVLTPVVQYLTIER